jgi:hypothetical protein
MTMTAPGVSRDAELAEHAEAIRALGKPELANDAIEIGRRLCRCKDLCGHGNWLPWVKREFGWRPSTAEKHMWLFRRTRDDSRLRNLAPRADYGDFVIDIKALMALADHKAPDEVIEEEKSRGTNC